MAKMLKSKELEKEAWEKSINSIGPQLWTMKDMTGAFLIGLTIGLIVGVFF